MANILQKTWFVLLLTSYILLILPIPQLRDLIVANITAEYIYLYQYSELQWIAETYDQHFLVLPFSLSILFSAIFIFKDNFISFGKHINRNYDLVENILLIFLNLLMMGFCILILTVHLSLRYEFVSKNINLPPFLTLEPWIRHGQFQILKDILMTNYSFFGVLIVLILSFILLLKSINRETTRKKTIYSSHRSTDKSEKDNFSTGESKPLKAVDYLNMAESYKEEKMFDMAAENYMQIGKMREAAQMFFLANKFIEAGKIYKELKNYKEAAESYKKGGRYIFAAECYKTDNNHKMAAVMYKKGDDFFLAGKIYLDLEQPEDAEECFIHLQEGSESHFMGIQLLGDYFVVRKNWSGAIRNYQRIVSGKDVNSNNIEVWYKLGRAVEKESGIEMAVEIYEQILSANFLYKDVNERMGKNLARKKEEERKLLERKNVDLSRSNSENRYKILKEIGKGGMGVVYKANDTVLDRIVAFKVLSAPTGNNSDAINEFKREARSIASLNHPNIVSIYDFGEDKENYFIVMEYVDGFNLKEICKGNKNFIIPSFKRIFVQICDGLAYAHSKNIIHRDIKPLNIMLNRSGTVKIMDFGLAKFVEEVNISNSVIKGTPHFMPPEQIMGEGLDLRADIFALGVTMYYLLAGNRYPFESGEILYHNVHSIPPSLKDKNSIIDDDLNDIVMKCIEKEKGKRYQSIIDLKSDIVNLKF